MFFGRGRVKRGALGLGVERSWGGEAGFGRMRGFGRAWGAVGGAALEHPRHKKRAYLSLSCRLAVVVWAAE